MTKLQWSSLAVVLACFAAMGVWDAIAIYYGGRKASISYLITMGTYYCPLIAFLFGVIAGHFFWPMASYQDDMMPERRVEVRMDDKGNVLGVTEKIVESR